MSQPNLQSVSSPSVLSKKPQLNVYTVMLIVALISLLTACLFLYLELREYGGWNAVQGRIGAVTAPYTDVAPTFWA